MGVPRACGGNQTIQLDAQTFLRLAEKAGELGFLDIEATGLRGDYNSVLVVSVKRWGKRPVTYAVDRPGDDTSVVLAAKADLDSLACWVTYYGKGYDVPMLNTRLLAAGSPPLAQRHHVDMYYVLKFNLLTARRSQGHLLLWAGTPEQKMGVSAEVWNKVLADPKAWMPTMIRRCNSDTAGLQGLYTKTKHLIREIQR